MDNGLTERLINIRKTENLSQSDFAKRLDLSRNFISLVENGNRELSDRTLKDICKEFNENENWLRTGEGEPRIPLTRKQAITDFMADCLKDEDDSFRSGLIEALAELSVEEWEVLEKIATTAVKDKMAKKD